MKIPKLQKIKVEHKIDKIKSPIAKYCVSSIACLLLCSCAFLFLVFRTNNIIDITEADVSKSTTIHRTSVTSVISSIATTPTSNNTDGNPPALTDSWYQNVPSNLQVAGKSVQTLHFSDGDVDLYDGLPWNADASTYLVNTPLAASDTVSYIDAQSGKTSNLSTANTYTYELGNKSCVQDSNGIKCLGFAPMPIIVTKDYCNAFNTSGWYQASSPSVNYGYLKDGNPRKYCVILKGKSDSTTYYLPLFANDAKGHTFPGGVFQTQLQLASAAATPQGPFSLNIGDTGARGQSFTWAQLVDALDTVKGEPGKYNDTLRSFFRVCLEIYGGSTSDCRLLGNYDIVGFVAWP